MPKQWTIDEILLRPSLALAELLTHPANLEWVYTPDNPAAPEHEGWYRVMYPGDSEVVDGIHVLYDYPDYEGWAYWTPAKPEEYEEHDGGCKGSWATQHDDFDEGIFAYLGPFVFEPYKDKQKAQEVIS